MYFMLSLNYQFLRMSLKVFRIFRGTFFPKVILYLEKLSKHRDTTNVSASPHLLIVSIHSAAAPPPMRSRLLISHSRSEWAAECGSPGWGRLPVSCQLILPTSCCLPPAVAPICESPAGPKRGRVRV